MRASNGEDRMTAMPFSQPADRCIKAVHPGFKLNTKGCASGQLPFDKAEFLLAQDLRGRLSPCQGGFTEQ